MASRFLSGFLMLLASASSVFAACAGGENVKVTVVVILASEQGKEIDKRLKNIAEEIQKQNPNLKSFSLKSMTSKSLALGVKSPFPLVEEKNAQIVIVQTADKNNNVVLGVTPPDQGEIVFRTKCGKFLPIVTRYHTKNKERLILAIRVQPCNE